ncbi:Hypothetical protein I595_2857 [Croceitalea dokdonensis DOKDO 023]|uniref:Uncharacterized protein n=1 Tax=Croceitalea dokdonensis DOKDO 023 TaxID=1300341 RepID=A0A0P7ACC3_9FLAO|nr:DUF2764 family protein [Croceitalea dokdonensis]KPM30880.1 Hypothetical protein I595_2857 [Croceitalea dokdonensis DOKDO 023]
MISGDLEYTISSLPYLSFQDTAEERSKVLSILKKYAHPSESEKDLITILDGETRKFLPQKAYEIFQQIELNTIHSEAFQKSGNNVLAAFSSYMHSLKKDVQQLRIFRRNESESTTKKLPLPLVPGTPLEEEIQLLQWQWDKLEELSLGHYADFGALVIYKLKLQLLLRWWGFDQEQGFENFLNTTKRMEDGR